MAAVKPLLQTTGLKRHFGGLKAADGIAFVSLLSGRTSVSEGTITFDGADITRLPAFRRVERGIAYTFQITNIYQSMTVADNIRIAVQSRARRHAAGAFDFETAVATALSAVGLDDRADSRAGDLAYGHQRLLEIAMGLALEPKLLILDEPTQGLSDPEIDNFLGLVRQIARTATVLLIEHNMHVVMSLAHRISVLTRGRLLAEGTPDEISANAEVQAAYLGS